MVYAGSLPLEDFVTQESIETVSVFYLSQYGWSRGPVSCVFTTSYDISHRLLIGRDGYLDQSRPQHVTFHSHQITRQSPLS